MANRAETAEAETQALVADALERALDAFDAPPRASDHPHRSDGVQSKNDRCEHGIPHYEDCHDCSIQSVAALIPADHAAALAARDERMRAEGRKAGMERAGDLCNSVTNSLGARPGSPMFSALIEYRAAIRAEMGGEA